MMMIKGEYLENAARLEREAAKVNLPNLKAVLLKQAELYRKLGNELAQRSAGDQQPSVAVDGAR
jgi:hypothetical protein